MRDLTPTHVIEVTLDRGTMSPIHWKRKEYGSPCEANLAEVVARYNASMLPGGCNDHLSASIVHAELVRVAGGEVLAEVDAGGAVA
jgi:hypothetical protein